jgi:hypothetical protein
MSFTLQTKVYVLQACMLNSNLKCLHKVVTEALSPCAKQYFKPREQAHCHVDPKLSSLYRSDVLYACLIQQVSDVF